MRSLLGDGATDKFTFRANVAPPPDGVTKRFFVGDTRIIGSSLIVTVAGTDVPPSGFAPSGVVEATGTFTLNDAPSAAVELQATYYYQWFNDTELLDFLGQGIAVLGFQWGDEIAWGLQPVTAQFAAYFAYLFKAAEFADSLSGGSPQGYTFDQKQATPNWLSLARLAFDMGGKLLDLYNRGAVKSQQAAIAFANYRLTSYVPRT